MFELGIIVGALIVLVGVLTIEWVDDWYEKRRRRKFEEMLDTWTDADLEFGYNDEPIKSEEDLYNLH